jgi:serine phosphatase RsbU (regulator of sigma subunit)
VQTVLTRLAGSARAVLPQCAGASVTWLDRGQPITAAYTDEVALTLDHCQYDIGRGPCLEAVQTGKMVRWRQNDGRWSDFADAADGCHIAEVLSVPIAVGDVVLGGLNLYSTVPQAFSADPDQMTASLLAEQGAVALATAQPLHVEREAVIALQRSLLPDVLVQVPGYDLAARYLPATLAAEVGGDWYDAFRADDASALVLAVGDVAGHGLEAASLMGQLRTALRAYAFEGQPPRACLPTLSRLLEMMRRDDDLQLATACLVLVDPSTGMCRVASAGHPPPVVRQPDGTVEFLAGLGGPPLGVKGSHEVGEEFVALRPGAALVLYTDGLVEDRHRGLEAGLVALANVLAEPAASADALCRRLVAALVGDGIREDDVALLVLRRLVG